MTESVSASYDPDSARTLAQAAWATMARRARWSARQFGESPKEQSVAAIANGMRELASTLACSDPKDDTIIAPRSGYATGPRNFFSTSVATEELAGMLATSRATWRRNTPGSRTDTARPPPASRHEGARQIALRIADFARQGATLFQPS